MIVVFFFIVNFFLFYVVENLEGSKDLLEIVGCKFYFCLMMGIGKYFFFIIMQESVVSSGCQIVIVVVC